MFYKNPLETPYILWAHQLQDTNVLSSLCELLMKGPSQLNYPRIIEYYSIIQCHWDNAGRGQSLIAVAQLKFSPTEHRVLRCQVQASACFKGIYVDSLPAGEKQSLPKWFPERKCIPDHSCLQTDRVGQSWGCSHLTQVQNHHIGTQSRGRKPRENHLF